MTIGKKISTERLNKGLSQELLAENSGVSLRTIQRIENDATQPRPYTLKVIAEALKMEVKELRFEQNIDAETLINHKSLTKINLINSSTLLGIFIPFLNIIAPIIIWNFNKKNPLVNKTGKKIISFQILWVLFSCLIIYAVHFIHYKITGQFVSGRVSSVIVVYFLLLAINVFFIISNSIRLKKQNAEIYPFVPILF